MDSSKLVRKETQMDVVHSNQKQLATRWDVGEASLERHCGTVRIQPPEWGES